MGWTAPYKILPKQFYIYFPRVTIELKQQNQDIKVAFPFQVSEFSTESVPMNTHGRFYEETLLLQQQLVNWFIHFRGTEAQMGNWQHRRRTYTNTSTPQGTPITFCVGNINNTRSYIVASYRELFVTLKRVAYSLWKWMDTKLLFFPSKLLAAWLTSRWAVRYEDFGSTTDLLTQYLLLLNFYFGLFQRSPTYVLWNSEQVCVSKLIFLHNKRSELADMIELCCLYVCISLCNYEFIYLFKMYLLFYFNSLHFKFDLFLMNYFSIFYILFFVLDFRAFINKYPFKIFTHVLL